MTKARRPGLALAVAFLTAFCLQVPAAGQGWLIVSGKSIGPIHLGMKVDEVLRLLGSPASRAGGVWGYDRPIRVRIEFQNERIQGITTWDLATRTSQGLGIGAPLSALGPILGDNPEQARVGSGLWLFNRILGVAVFVENGVAAAYMVMPQTQTAARASATPSTRTVAPPQSPPIPTAAGPLLVFEEVSHKVEETVVVSGKVRNLSQVPRLGVIIAGSAKSFRGSTSKEGRVVIQPGVNPGRSEPFTIDLGRALWQSYAVTVETYTPINPSKDVFATLEGNIGRHEYVHWTQENLAKYANASAIQFLGDDHISVRASIGTPSYARVLSVLVDVRWTAHRAGGLSSGSTVVAISGFEGTATVPSPCPPRSPVGPRCNVTASARVIQVNWVLNY